MNRTFRMVLAFLCAATVSGGALAGVKHDGNWPKDEKPVSLDATHVTRAEALSRLAGAAGWNLVSRVDDGKGPVDVHVKNEPPGKLLDVLLDDGDYVARRDGSMITLEAAPAPKAAEPAPPPPASGATAAAVEPAPPPPVAAPKPAATTRGEDRVAHGGNMVVGPEEVVHDVTVLGGDLDVQGTATGNVTVMGGSAHIEKGAHVVGNATAVGGALHVDDGAQIDGNVGVVGGVLDRAKGAKIGGAVHKTGDGTDAVSISRPHHVLRSIGDALTRTAMLFVFGAVLFALGSRKMESLRVEAASRPMRSFALGVVGLFLGLVGVAALCVTVIGIPVAIVALLVGIFAAYAGICSVLSTVGKALVAHKTDNPYLHLLVGCALYLVTSSVPFVGGLITLAVVLTGIGVVVATRGAGAFPAQRGRLTGGGPYRASDAV